ncbi:hypothetical protein GXW83_22965 [Streptacidiphilus sp. PB12-B1b]|uniref:DUF6059 family protein n=1 Tax=Streptacidiphilus sp. PB12-B1b TaxID=2705012 RepID=UPI0015FBBD38|nr:DUF6059 family protein [Streptacidiphilus sp. PB12-B1b]QMU78133.1 hypothetical protein GXW83_22965 [Streptacidiphilus sp. PB12-B1b]
MRRLARGFIRYVFYPTLRSFAVYGQLFAPMGAYVQGGPLGVAEHLYPAPPRARRVAAGGPLADLPPGHPERLCPDLLLSEFERQVLRQMDPAAPVD